MYVNTWLAGDDTHSRQLSQRRSRSPVSSTSGRPPAQPSTSTRPISIDPTSLVVPTAITATQPALHARNRGGAAGAANVFYALGEHSAHRLLPLRHRRLIDDANKRPRESYSVLARSPPLILEQQPRGNVHGFSSTKPIPPSTSPSTATSLTSPSTEIFGYHSDNGFGLIMATGPDEFLGAGKGFRVSFTAAFIQHARRHRLRRRRQIRIDGKWIPGRRLNGDENDQGNYWRFDPRQVRTEKAIVYRFE